MSNTTLIGGPHVELIEQSKLESYSNFQFHYHKQSSQTSHKKTHTKIN